MFYDGIDVVYENGAREIWSKENPEVLQKMFLSMVRNEAFRGKFITRMENSTLDILEQARMR